MLRDEPKPENDGEDQERGDHGAGGQGPRWGSKQPRAPRKSETWIHLYGLDKEKRFCEVS